MRRALISLTICSPYPVVADTLKRVLSHQPGIALTGTTTAPAEALNYSMDSDIFMVHAALPQQVVLDLYRVVSRSTSARVIVFGTRPDEAELLQIIEAGARGYVPSGRPFGEWLEGMRAVASDGAWIDAQLTLALLKRHRELRLRIARLA